MGLLKYLLLFSWQADLGVVYWNACNAVQAMNILTHKHHRVRVERIFTPQKLPATFTRHAKDNNNYLVNILN